MNTQSAQGFIAFRSPGEHLPDTPQKPPKSRENAITGLLHSTSLYWSADVHEFTRRLTRMRDPDKTNPPTRVEDLWGWRPDRGVHSRPNGDSEAGPRPDSPVALTDNDAVSLYWAARDCMIAGAYAGATVLLRRLIVHMTDETANKAGTREEAERLFACAEELLGRPHEPSSERSAEARERDPHERPSSVERGSPSRPGPSSRPRSR